MITYYLSCFYRNNQFHLTEKNQELVREFFKDKTDRRYLRNTEHIDTNKKCILKMYLPFDSPTNFVQNSCEFLQYCKITSYVELEFGEMYTVSYDPFSKPEDYKFKSVLEELLEQEPKKNRTGTKSRSISSVSMSFDITNNKIPLTTIRKIPYRHIISELLWILRGDTNTDFLEKYGNKVWRQNTSRQFLDSLNTKEYIPTGSIGRGYGHQLRNFEGVDQLKYIEDKLKNDPSSRRIMFSLWNPKDLEYMALPPCHFLFMIRVDGEYIDTSLVMRSSDELARSWNCTYYSILSHLLALRNGYKARKFTIFINDCHIYENAVPQAMEYKDNIPRNFPIIKLSEELKTLDFNEMTPEMFDIKGYFPNKFYKIDMVA